jgi:hypothetical protein
VGAPLRPQQLPKKWTRTLEIVERHRLKKNTEEGGGNNRFKVQDLLLDSPGAPLP